MMMMVMMFDGAIYSATSTPLAQTIDACAFGPCVESLNLIGIVCDIEMRRPKLGSKRASTQYMVPTGYKRCSDTVQTSTVEFCPLQLELVTP